MQTWQSSRNKPSRSRAKSSEKETPLAVICLQIVDACLIGILFLAPLFFGGRHLLGRFVFILLASVAGIAWFTRQALLKRGKWTRSWANVLGLAMILSVAIQLLPLPIPWIEKLAPRNTSLLTLWTGDTSHAPQLGLWQTLSLTPSSTKIALATLIAYVLLFVTAVGRLQNLADVQHLFRLIALAVILMSGFGILQYFTSNGLFFWFYEHPFTTTARAAKGSFTTRNHFAHFIALGVGPLLAWAVIQLRSSNQKQSHNQHAQKPFTVATSIALHVGLGLTALAVLLSLSRGGALALAIVSTLTIIIYYRRGLLSGTYLYGLAMLGLLIVGMLSISGYEQVATRLDDFTAGSLEELDNNEGRRKIWAANIAATQQGSLFGSGAGSHREIYPVYLPQSLNIEYTHAENGYLQIATENGLIGIALLGLTIVMISTWCYRALRNATSNSELILAGAVTAGLTASVVHSIVDFVWFIPACMSLTILLAACALRVAQLTKSSSTAIPPTIPCGKLRWASITAVAFGAAAWAVSTTIGPAAASLHWDSYLLASKSSNQQRLTNKPLTDEASDQLSQIDAMIFHLQNILAHDPQSARAHLRLARKYLQQFKQRQQDSDNSMSVDQIRDAAMASKFDSSKSLQQWLLRAFGENSRLLYKAHYHTRQALRLCPLQGEGYLYLADLCFLEGHTTEAIDAYVQQTLQVRPYDGDLLFEVGRRRLLLGQVEQAFNLWQQIYHDTGTHQLKIIRLLAGQMPAEIFIQTFNPNWQTMRQIWQEYRQQEDAENWQTVLSFAEEAAQRECPEKSPRQASNIWHALASMQKELHHEEAALSSIQRAYHLTPNSYWVRRVLGQKLLRAEHYQQAEPHLRWCLARRPDDNALRNELVQATKSRLSNTATTAIQSQYQ